MTAFTPAYIAKILPLLWDGMQVTLVLVAGAYVDLFRSLPLILLIFWFYFLVPLIVGHSVGGFYSALSGFILFEAAYFCEIIRSGIQSVRRGQVLAGLATGLTHRQT